jgi:hypothetical protein
VPQERHSKREGAMSLNTSSRMNVARPRKCLRCPRFT